MSPSSQKLEFPNGQGELLAGRLDLPVRLRLARRCRPLVPGVWKREWGTR